MLGDKLGDEQGEVTGMRVLPSGPHGQQVEVSFRASGTFLDLQVTDMGTYTSTMRPDGTMFGEGQGIVMTNDGASASWTGFGAGRLTGQGSAASWRGALFYQTMAQPLAELNGIAVVFEFDVDQNGKTNAVIWEWK